MSRFALVAAVVLLVFSPVLAQPAPAEPTPIPAADTATAAAAEVPAPVAAAPAPEAAPAHDEAAAHSGTHIGDTLPLWTPLPFIALLLCIAILPLVAGHWWEHNSNKAIVAALWAIPIGLYIATVDYHLLIHTAHEYFSFIVLLGALFTISGGIYITGNLTGRPLTNLTFLIIGSILANFIGTTGASMVLIRPLLRANSDRKHKQHIFIFFIFIVSNCGGMLTPLGDPPLFLGFLRGVEFFWTLKLFPQWALVNILVMATFMGFEMRAFAKERPEDIQADLEVVIPVGISGRVNILFLLGVLGAVFIQEPVFLREGIMIVMALLSYYVAPKAPRNENKFTFTAINEVAILFAGIFITMVPALQILEARGDELGINTAWKFYWATGALSSFLDNAPTYLTFASTACGLTGASVDNLQSLLHVPNGELFLAAISCGAVMMGANSYIGNGPNFMVKAIVEEGGVKMPTFFGYMIYSGLVLIPSFIIVTLVFFI